MSRQPDHSKIGVKVRDFLSFSSIELMNGLKTNLNVIFEDGVVKYLTANEIITNRFMWELVNSGFKTLPIISTYSVDKYYTNGIYTSKSLNKLFEVMFRDIVRHDQGSRENLPKMFKLMQEIFNDIYNELVISNADYAMSLNILDFLKIQFQTPIIESILRVKKEMNNESISDAYKVLDHEIYNNPDLKDNPLAIGYIGGTFNVNQVKQLLSSRGYITEINSKIFQRPVPSPFTLGLRGLYDLTVESRSSAKALFMSTKDIQSTEYTSREFQLATMPVKNLVDGDCGNRDYMPWRVKTAEESGKSDLVNLIGKRYYDPVTKTEKYINKEDKHLEGTEILIRPAFNCKHTNKHSICTSCFGELSYNIHKYYSLGHLCSATLGQAVSQAVLSTKHHNMSAVTAAIILHGSAKEWFNVKNKNSYAFKPNLIKNIKGKVNIIISQEGAGIKDLDEKVDVYKLNPTRVSRIESFLIQVIPDKGKEEIYPILVRDGQKYGAFTYEFLDYISKKPDKKRYTLDDNDRYVIDISDWTSTTNIITLPQIEYNFLALSNAVKSRFKYMSTKNGANTPESVLSQVFDIVNSKLNINIALLEIMVYAFTVMDVKGRNYDLGRNTEKQDMVDIYTILGKKSIGGLYAHERVIGPMLSFKVAEGRNNYSHPLDVYIKPHEVVKFES